MNQPIYLSDLKILLQLMAPSNLSLEIWDPERKLIQDNQLPLSYTSKKGFKVLVNVSQTEAKRETKKVESFDLVMDFTGSLSLLSYHSKSLNYLNNPNGKMRWLFSNQNTEATFLQFYNASSVRAKLIYWGIKMGFALHLQKFIKSGSLKFYSKNPLKIEKLVQQIPHKDYSVFLGSEGENRTVLVETHAQNSTTYFIKIPITQLSQRSVAHEKQFLMRAKNFSFRTFQYPKVVDNRFRDVLVTQSIAASKDSRTNQFTFQHAKVLYEIASKTTRFNKLKHTRYWDGILENLSNLKRNHRFDKEVEMMHQLKNDLTEIKSVYTCVSHGDFTPWNIYTSRTQLKVYDWEMAQDQMPQLFDLFHYHFQTGVLIDRVKCETIKKRIDKSCTLPQIQRIIRKYEIDIDMYWRFYVLKASSTYFKEFQKNEELSVQHKWLAQALKHALHKNCLYMEDNHRKVFIRDFNAQLQSTQHVFLKLVDPDVLALDLSSDLDILIEPKGVKEMIAFCEKHSHVNRVRVHAKSFMTTLEIYFKDHGFLAVDLITQFKRKSLQFLDAQVLLRSAQKNAKGFYVPHPALDFEYAFLFYHLNHAGVPKKYETKFLNSKTAVSAQVLDWIKTKYDLQNYSSTEICQESEILQSELLKIVGANSSNQGLNGLKNNVRYLRDTWKDMFNRQSLVITFSGVDGAGKTTIIGKVKSRLEQKYRKEVVLLRHRPGILPILSAIKHGKKKAESIASVTLPRKGTNANVLSSTARFAYYYSDYLIGQLYVYMKYTLRGKVVLYDRYYFDFINDAKRSNIQLNRRFLKSLYALVFKPDLNFFLYADAATILKRKKEMNAHEIESISGLYQTLFNQMSKEQKHGIYTSIENKYLDRTLSQVWKSYQQVA